MITLDFKMAFDWVTKHIYFDSKYTVVHVDPDITPQCQNTTKRNKTNE